MRQPVRPKGWVAWGLIAVATLYLVLMVALPLANVFYQAFREGWSAYVQGLTTPEALHAIGLTLLVVGIAVPLNTVFGLVAAWVLARYPLPGKGLVLTLLDAPLAISPVIVGLMFILLYSPTVGIFRHWVEALKLSIVFAPPGLVLTTMFVTLPFVVREVLPVLESTGREEEEAAQTLGAHGWQIFWRVTLPQIRWALLYGVILTTARALGEYGAAAVISGKVINLTNTLTLHIERVYMEYQTVAAFAGASLLTVIALVTVAGQALVGQTDRR
ncbi:MAG: sulfate ABC transporter permease subunit CysW [Gloeomargarita sp. SKYG116]|nr:sulfate ABC transporter permease subunit CysW [Gloeomargarita sp. SKYG116]MDW8400511.1 sulfate ABC transporter permease subunit CysW [Gloeomargarita sp. SKYGB_i_bin116]